MGICILHCRSKMSQLASGFQIMVIVALNACVIVLEKKTPSTTGTNHHSSHHYSLSSRFWNYLWCGIILDGNKSANRRLCCFGAWNRYIQDIRRKELPKGSQLAAKSSKKSDYAPLVKSHQHQHSSTVCRRSHQHTNHLHLVG